jgi:uncharacterized protein YqhQ
MFSQFTRHSSKLTKFTKFYQNETPKPKKNFKKSIILFGVVSFGVGLYFVTKKKNFSSGVNEDKLKDGTKPKLVILGT